MAQMSSSVSENPVSDDLIRTVWQDRSLFSVPRRNFSSKDIVVASKQPDTSIMTKLQQSDLMLAKSVVSRLGLKPSTKDISKYRAGARGTSFETALERFLKVRPGCLYYQQKFKADPQLPHGVYLHPLLLQDYICYLSPDHSVIAQAVVFSVLFRDLEPEEILIASHTVKELQTKITDFVGPMESLLKKLQTKLTQMPEELALIDDCSNLLTKLSVDCNTKRLKPESTEPRSCFFQVTMDPVFGLGQDNSVIPFIKWDANATRGGDIYSEVSHFMGWDRKDETITWELIVEARGWSYPIKLDSLVDWEEGVVKLKAKKTS